MNKPLDFKQAILELKKDGVIYERKAGFVLCSSYGMFSAVVSRVTKTFGFIKKEDGSEVFIPGKFLKGAMPNDVVLARLIPQRGDLPEGEVIKVIQENFSEFTGTIEKENGVLGIRPDSLTKELIVISSMKIKAKEGDKVLAEISKRGERHADHRAVVTGLFGASEKASSSAMAVLHLNAVETEFPYAVLDEARHIAHMGIDEKEIAKRLDLRGEMIFTIDGADTKDIDDAISVKKTDSGYELGVHMPMYRIMLSLSLRLTRTHSCAEHQFTMPTRLSLCSLKSFQTEYARLIPMRDRLAFSCLMKLTSDGKLDTYKFSKTVIRSRVKGVYSEINQILDGKPDIDPEIIQKYSHVRQSLALMEELAEILTANKLKRGAPQIDTPECKLILDENDVCIDVKKRERGKSELIIEEFMLMANTAAAKLARKNKFLLFTVFMRTPLQKKLRSLLILFRRWVLRFRTLQA
jgi:ribonuclease R